MHTVIGCYGIIDRHHSATLSYRVDVEHVDGEVVGGEVHGAEELLQRHHSPLARLAHLGKERYQVRREVTNESWQVTPVHGLISNQQAL